MENKNIPNALSVKQLNMYIKMLLEGDKNLRNVFVRGEISNFVLHNKSGHIYMTLKDDEASVRAVMFKSSADKLVFEPSDGMEVFVRGRVSLYERDGNYQLYVEEIIPNGISAFYLQFLQLKEKLEKEGLFDRDLKREIPEYPMKIGIATSPTGAAVQDLLAILGRRWPIAEVLIYPCLMQGEQVASSVMTAIDWFEEQKDIDLVIVARGGGSYEDLAYFNNELLVRRVAACEVPIISAIGHETDFTLIDFAADLRAATPSAAAELGVPDKNEQYQYLMGLQSQMLFSINNRLKNSVFLLNNLKNRINIDSFLASRMVELDVFNDTMRNLIRLYSEKQTNRFVQAGKLLESLNPMSVLMRGYGIISSDGGNVITSVKQVKSGKILKIKLKDGDVESVAK